ncbi:MAG: nucleotide-binding protein [Thermomicrobiales bacterium]
MNQPYLIFLRRWWWLLVLGAAIALIGVRLSLRHQQPLYLATATVQVGQTVQDKNPDQSQIAIIQQLVPTYAAIAQRDPVLLATAQALNLPLTPDELRARLVVTPVKYVPLIDISVVDSDPVRAAAIANEVARQLALKSPSPSAQDVSSQQFIQNQLNDLQKKISDAQTASAKLQDQIGTLTSASDIDEANRKMAALQEQILSWQTTYGQLLASVQPSRTNQVTVISEAMPPTAPLPKRNLLYYLLALVIGGGLGTLLALALEFVFRPLTSTRELAAFVSGPPTLAVPRYPVPAEVPMLAAKPESDASTAYRLLRNALYTDGVDGTGLTLAVTSSQVAEGKTTTAVNLALALANAGRKVVLVDANLRNPGLDRWFAATAAAGFNDLLVSGGDGPGFNDLLLSDCLLEQVLQETPYPGLRFVGVGNIPDKYADLLSQNSLSDVVATLALSADVVIFDTGAISEELDSLLLAKYVNGVVLVAEADRIKQDEVRHAIEMLGRTGTPLVAVVLNKVRRPRLRLESLPWSRVARNRVTARQHRQRHAWQGADQAELRSPAD